jgi:hypothetical protein
MAHCVAYRYSSFLLCLFPMKSATEHPRPIPFVRKLCSDLGETTITEAEERLSAYVKIMIKIFERSERGSLD